MSHSKVDNQSQLQDGHSFNLCDHFFHVSKQVLLITDHQFNIIQLNNQACQLLGLNMKACLNQAFDELLSRVSKADLQEHFDKMKILGDCSDEIIIQDQTGKSVILKYDVHYNGSHFFISMYDITCYKKNEQMYDMSTKIFEDIFAKVTDGMLLFDQKGKVIDVNGTFLSIVGLEKSELIGKYFHTFLEEEDKKGWLSGWEQLLEEGQLSTLLKVTNDNRTYYFKCHAYTNIYNYHFIGIFKDMTEKKFIERQLKKSENMFELIFEQAKDGIVLSDDKGIVEANTVACEIFEIQKEDLIGKKLFSFVGERDDRFKEMLNELNQIGNVRAEFSFHMPNGQKKVLEFTSNRVENTNTKVTIIRNVSERYEMEQKLRESEKHFREIFEGLNVGLLLWRNNEIKDINKVGSKILFHSKKTILKRGMHQLWSETVENHEDIKKMMKKLVETSHVKETILLKFLNGSTKYMRFSTKKHVVNDLNLTIFEDVTDMFEMQEQLRKSDTLSVVGELAAGIAHEIRNPMTALKGFIQLLQGSVKGDFSNYFNIITSELKRIDTIITEFLVLAKPQVIRYEEKDMNVIVQETVDLLSAESTLYNIIFDTDFFRDSLYLYCEPNQLKQVFINILKNALESMTNGGNIRIKTDLVDEEYVKISITDEGIGIPKEKLKKLGEPFYTTKDRGTGLGLMISFKIIEEHRGWIEVDSEVGVGTVFSVYLPYRNQNVSW